MQSFLSHSYHNTIVYTVKQLLTTLPEEMRALVQLNPDVPYWLQPQTLACLQVLLQQLAKPPFNQLTVVQTQQDADVILNGKPFVWVDTTVATAATWVHKPQDFVITVGIGQTLPSLNAALATQQQTIGYTPAVGRFFSTPFIATVGMCIAYNWLPLEAGIKRTTLNELVLGLAGYAASTGKPVAFGGEVVKNVTGYDVQKFLIGHQYGLGVISQATLKTFPSLPVRGGMVQCFTNRNLLFQALAAYLAQPSLWLSSLVVTPTVDTATDSSAFNLIIGVEAPTVALLQVWQQQWCPQAVWMDAMPSLCGKQLKEDPALVLEVALPCGQLGWQQALDIVLPLFVDTPLEWQLLPACGLLQLAFTEGTLPTRVTIQLLQQQLVLWGGAFKVVYATGVAESFKNQLLALQWQQLPDALQRYTQQLKQQIDPAQQFFGRYCLGTITLTEGVVDE